MEMVVMEVIVVVALCTQTPTSLTNLPPFKTPHPLTSQRFHLYKSWQAIKTIFILIFIYGVRSGDGRSFE